MPDRGLKIATHPGREDRGLRKPITEPGSRRGDVRERGIRVGTERGHRHQPGELQPGARGDVFGEPEEPLSGHASSQWVTVDAVLQQNR